MLLNGINEKMPARYGKRLEHLFAASFWAIICCIQPVNLYAHGAKLIYQLTTEIVVQAFYDTGQPMSSAQITVYAPDDPTRPWLTDSSNEQGEFRFVPTPGVTGIWSVQARQAGHGAIIHIDVVQDDSSTRIGQVTQVVHVSSLLQRLMMAAAVIWGCVGTALYFVRRRSA